MSFESNVPLQNFLAQLSALTAADVVKGFRSITFGGTGEIGAYPWRGTANKYEDPDLFYNVTRWQPDGTFGNSGESWFRMSWPFFSTHYEIPLLTCLVYVIVIFGLQRYLRDRQPVQWLTRRHIAAWNLMLCLFSLAGISIALPNAYDFIVVQGHGVAADVCLPWPEWKNGWTLWFVMSKFPELLDTVFLVLKKKPVIFLHWYHHITVLLYCWDGWAVVVPQAGFFATMNFFVHTIMYFYYFLMCQPFSFQIRLPSIVPFFITCLQILQMVAGLYILYF